MLSNESAEMRMFTFSRRYLDLSRSVLISIYLDLDLSWYNISIPIPRSISTVSQSVMSSSLWLHGLWPTRLFCPWNSPDKNIGVSDHSLYQGIFLTQGSNPGLLHCMKILYHLSHQRSPSIYLYLYLYLSVQFSHSVMSNSLWLHGLWPIRLLCSWEFSRQEYWSGLPCPPPGDLPNPGIKPKSPALQVDSLPSEPPGKPRMLEWLAHLFCRVSSQPRNWTRVSCFAGGFFTS